MRSKISRKDVVLAPVRPNAGIAAAYRRKLMEIVKAISEDTTRKVRHVYQAYADDIALDEEPSPETLTNPEIDRIRALAEGGDDTLLGAQGPVVRLEKKGLIRLGYDPESGSERWELTAAGEKIARKLMTPASRLKAVIGNLRDKWLKRIDDTAPKLAAYFNTAIAKRSKFVLDKALRDGGFSVKFQMTQNMRTVYDATISENVGLIKSIPAQYLTEVEGLVMRSVQRGRDLGELSKELQKRYKITERRAALIALDQNNKSTSAIVHARQLDLGIREGIWRHSHAGKEPRPTHLKMDGKKYPLNEGMYDADPRIKRKVFPGELIRCFPGWTKVNFADGVEKAYRHWYAGELVTLVTDTNKTLRATPNHPVLTSNGWVAIGLLKKGDYIIEIADKVINSIMSKSNADHAIPLISDIFCTIKGSGFSEVSLGANFHGDITECNIDIVSTTRPLRIGIKAGLSQLLLNIGLAEPTHLLPRERVVDQLGFWKLFSSDCIMRGLGQSLAASLSFMLHAQTVGVASATYDAGSRFDVLDDNSSRYFIELRKLKNACAVLMPRTQKVRIVKVDNVFFEGHVFNLQTSNGWYVAEGIIVHNCRCFWQPVVKGFE